jgi:hypothetical protein
LYKSFEGFYRETEANNFWLQHYPELPPPQVAGPQPLPLYPQPHSLKEETSTKTSTDFYKNCTYNNRLQPQTQQVHGNSTSKRKSSGQNL